MRDGRGGADSASTDRGRARPDGRSTRMHRATSPRERSAAARARRRPDRGRRPPRGRPAPPPPRAVPPGAWRRAQAVSASTSQVPFEPSVSTRWCTTQPACRPLGQRPAAPELDVVGMGADGQRRAMGDAMSVDQSAVRPSRSAAAGRVRWQRRQHLLRSGVGEVVGRVDVEPSSGSRTTRTRHAEAMTVREVVTERAGAVAEPERRCRPAARATLVPSSRRSGTSVDRRRIGEAPEVGRQRQVAVGDDDAVVALAGQGRETIADGGVEPARRSPQHRRRRRSPPSRRRLESSQTTNTGWGAAAATTRPAIHCARRARSLSVRAGRRRPFASWNAFTGRRTATCTGSC